MRELKDKAVELAARMVAQHAEELRKVDERLLAYCKGMSEEPEVHNMYEILGVCKFLRVFGTYDFDIRDVQHAFRLYEGRWEDGRHVDGGLLFSGIRGRQHYRLTPIQVYMISGVLGPHCWVDTGEAAGSRSLLMTEEERDGRIWDRRRLVTEANFFIPRKFGKTTMGAFWQFYFFFFGDYNSEGYCCANSADQAKILYKMTYELIHQLDPEEKRIRFTASEINWKIGQPRASKVVALSAGGKTKDGLFAQVCSSDEYGSAGYVKNHSDMASLVNVVEGSMGPRREPLTVHTTTAGNVQMGPYQIKLDGIKDILRDEPANEPVVNESGALLSQTDRQFAVILQPDEWEMDEETIFSDQRIWRKVNPHIGVTVQPDFYDAEIAKSRIDPEKKKETITKLFNVFQSSQVKEWIVTADKIRRLQINRRVTDCKYDEGWDTFVGLDFSSGDDLFAITYFSVNRRNPELAMEQRFFADCEAWIVEKSLERSPNRPLYELWVEQGWLKVCPGSVFNPDYAINELLEKHEAGVNLAMFGYDPAQSKQPINTLKAWLQSLGIGAEAIKDMVVPVSQGYMTMNPLVGELEYYTVSPTPWLKFSKSPLWPFEFGNVYMEESREGLRKPLKQGSEKKVDNVHALLDACFCFDLQEGKVNP